MSNIFVDAFVDSQAERTRELEQFLEKSGALEEVAWVVSAGDADVAGPHATAKAGKMHLMAQVGRFVVSWKERGAWASESFIDWTKTKAFVGKRMLTIEDRKSRSIGERLQDFFA